MFVRIFAFVLGQIAAALHHQTARIHQPATSARLGLVQSLRHHGRRHQIGDTGGSLTGAQKYDGLIDQLGAGHAQC